MKNKALISELHYIAMSTTFNCNLFSYTNTSLQLLHPILNKEQSLSNQLKNWDEEFSGEQWLVLGDIKAPPTIQLYLCLVNEQLYIYLLDQPNVAVLGKGKQSPTIPIEVLCSSVPGGRGCSKADFLLNNI